MLPINIQHLPSSDELPCSDDTPVDNVGVSPSRSDDQNLLPNVLLFLLNAIWADRMDWYFAVLPWQCITLLASALECRLYPMHF